MAIFLVVVEKTRLEVEVERLAVLICSWIATMKTSSETPRTPVVGQGRPQKPFPQHQELVPAVVGHEVVLVLELDEEHKVGTKAHEVQVQQPLLEGELAHTTKIDSYTATRDHGSSRLKMSVKYNFCTH